jgi:hypothetical protein
MSSWNETDFHGQPKLPVSGAPQVSANKRLHAERRYTWVVWQSANASGEAYGVRPLIC